MSSWNDEDEPDYVIMNNIIDDAPNEFVRFNRVAATLQTTSFPCFPDGTYNPLDKNEILNDILDSPPPNNPESVIEEASLLSLVSDAGNTEENLAILNRYEDYFSVLDEEGSLGQVTETSEYVVDGLDGILNGGNQNDSSVLDGVYDVIGTIDNSLLCKMSCGEDPITIESVLLTLEASLDTLESIAGNNQVGDSGAGFQLPSDISLLEEQLGIGPGQCISSSTSVIGFANGLPVTSLTFYSNDCQNRTQIIISSLPEDFLIAIPINRTEENNSNENDCGDADEGEDDEATCLFGETLSNVTNTEGCSVVEINETHVICGCDHLTAFSALFVPGDGGGGGGDGCGGGSGWKWDILKTIAAALMGFALFSVIGIILYEHFVIHKEQMKAISSTLMKR